MDGLLTKCRRAVEGRRIIVACDTTDYNLDGHKNRIKDMEGLGWMGDNTKRGFIHHGLLAIDRDNKCRCYGWAGSYFYKRDHPEKNKRQFRANNKIEDKEPYKWLGPSLQSRDTVLQDARHTLFVMDREADIYEVLSKIGNTDKSDVLIRIQQNRRLTTVEGKSVKLYEDMAQSEPQGIVSLKIAGDRRKRTKRVAKLEIKYKSYWIKRSSQIKEIDKYPDQIKMQALEIKELASSVPTGEEPISWRLWTSEAITSIEKAIDLLECYRTRWHIEEAFRLLKTEGFNIESSELESGKSIRKLLLIAMEASVKIMQLKAVRDGDEDEVIHDYFTAGEVEYIEKLNEELEGESAKLRNPYLPHTLSYASWVIARLGGWKGYKSQRPPGTITYKIGLERFEISFFGYKIAMQSKDVCKR